MASQHRCRVLSEVMGAGRPRRQPAPTTAATRPGANDLEHFIRSVHRIALEERPDELDRLQWKWERLANPVLDLAIFAVGPT